MTRTDVLAIGGFFVVLSALMLAGGPLVGIGAVLGLAVAAAIFFFPVLGVAMMILAGTALQVLGSEHIIGLPLSLGKLFGGLTFVAWACRSYLYRVPVTFSPQIQALIAFAGVMALSVLVSPNKALALSGLFRYAQLYLLFFMIASIGGESRRNVEICCLAVTACMMVSSVLGLLEFFLPSLAIESDDPELTEGALGAIIDRGSIDGVEIKRITGGLSDSNWFAYALVPVLPLNLYLWHRYRSLGMRLFITAATMLQSVGIMLSYTRSALVGLAAALAVLVWKRRVPLAPIFACLVVGSAAVLIWSPPGLQRMFSTEYLKEGSTPLRAWLLRGATSAMIDSPLLGQGFSQFGPYFIGWLNGQQPPDGVVTWEKEFSRLVDEGQDRPENIMPHNLFFQVGVEFGLLGASAFFMFCWFIFHDLRLVERRGDRGQQELAVCLMAATAGFLACGLFGHVALMKLVWVLGGLAAALRRVVLIGDYSASVSRPAGEGTPA